MIRLICVGRLKERHYAEAAGEYLKRLRKYARTDVVELRECTDKNPEVAKRKEAEQILNKLDTDAYVIALDQRGVKLTTEKFAQLLTKPNTIFVLGGPDGLAQEILEKADLILSLSDMTLPHQLARVILLEQIYRGHTILNKEPYNR